MGLKIRELARVYNGYLGQDTMSQTEGRQPALEHFALILRLPRHGRRPDQTAMDSAAVSIERSAGLFWSAAFTFKSSCHGRGKFATH